MEKWREDLYYNYLSHHGIKGQKWGVRRFQNENGTLTDLGKKQAEAYRKEQIANINSARSDEGIYSQLYRKKANKIKSKYDSGKMSEQKYNRKMGKIAQKSYDHYSFLKTVSTEVKKIKNMSYEDLDNDFVTMGLSRLNNKDLSSIHISSLTRMANEMKKYMSEEAINELNIKPSKYYGDYD